METTNVERSFKKQWQQHISAAQTDLAAADTGYPDEVLGHLHDAATNITKAIESIESEEDEEDDEDLPESGDDL